MTWLLYLGLAALLLIIEVFSQMVWTLCLAIGSLAALAALLLGLGLEWQLVIMALAAIVAYVILVPYVKRWHEQAIHRQGRQARTGMDALLGREGIVTHQIKPGQMGRVQIDGDSWQAVAPGVEDLTIDRGSRVHVTGYDSIIIQVSIL